MKKAIHDMATKGPRIAAFILLGALGMAGLSAPAQAQGCSPAPSGGGGLPPCCATTDMSAGGECMASATQYRFTIYSFGFEKSDGTVVEYGNARSFDAASVNAGGDIGNYISGAPLTPGTYIAVRPTISRDFSVAARVTTRDGRTCSGSVTAPARQPGGLAWPNCAAGQPDAGTPVCLSGGQLRIRDDQIGTLNINGDSGVTINFKFDVNNGVICRFAPGSSPSSGVSLGVFSVRVTKS